MGRIQWQSRPTNRNSCKGSPPEAAGKSDKEAVNMTHRSISGRAISRLVAVLLVVVFVAGCGGGRTASKPKKSRKSKSSKKSRRGGGYVRTSVSNKAPGPAARPHENGPSTSFSELGNGEDKSKDGSEDKESGDEPENLEQIFGTPQIERIDPAALRRAGIRKVESQFLSLYTDLPPSKAIDELPEVFDAAVPEWCEYLGIAPSRVNVWRVNGFLIKDKSLFKQAGLIPKDLPNFLNGYAFETELWLNEQPSDYYRRHLLLHEGTHALMNAAQGRAGAPWYMEGVAELLGTHRWADDELTLGYFPASRHEAPFWGRVKIVKDAVTAKQAKTLSQIFNYDRRAHLKNEPYGWCWAACAFLDAHPRYQETFRKLYAEAGRLDDDFNQKARKLFADDWKAMQEEWQLFVLGLEYGHDVAKTAVDFSPGKPLATEGAEITVAADRGWQNSGVTLEGGVSYELEASGKYQVGESTKPWISEPGGISIHYYGGKPLGVLMMAVRPDDTNPAKLSPLARPKVVGLGATVAPKATGTLYFRVNDSAGELHDNKGTLKVSVRRALK